MNQEQPSPRQDEEPEFFDRALLKLPPEARLEYFEHRCLIEHPRLLSALEAILEAICAPGEGASARRPGTIVLVIGPARVGKTTLIRLLEERLLVYATAQMQRDPTFIPLASITAPEPGSGRFEWVEFYQPVLRQLGNPFVDNPTHPIRARQMREALLAAYLERKPLAIIVDEAHHLAEAARGSRLQSQLNHLKNFENLTGVSHILVGTYAMRPFRKVNAQLACRSVDVHFSRYDMTKEEDCQVFRSVLWALQRQLPVEEEPLLAERHWEFLYARSIGCIGLLKLHLNRALNRALREGAYTVTLDHLHQTATSDVRVKLALRNALESEAEFVEAEDADAQLLALLRKPPASASSAAKQKQNEQDQAKPSTTPGNRRKPGKRSPGRDPTGATTSEEERPEQTDEEQAVG
ncbi:MAG: ATP-binding protein [Ktedonobacteraceae bacterium]